MQKSNEIRQRIGAVEETRKITNAMQLVSSSRLRKVMPHIEFNNRMFMRIQQTMRDVLDYSVELVNPYLVERNEGRRRTYIVITGDKGLAGTYNTDIINLAMQHLSGGDQQLSLISMGLVGSDYFRTHGIHPDIEMMGTIQNPTIQNARVITDDIMNMYDMNLTDEVFIIYTSFHGSTRNHPVVKRILPILLSDYHDIPSSAHAGGIIYDPSPEELFAHLIPQYILGLLFGALVQAYASEHFSRMNAMRSATKNADEMLKKLRLQYNMARQSAITQEIIEMSGANEVLREKEVTSDV